MRAQKYLSLLMIAFVAILMSCSKEKTPSEVKPQPQPQPVETKKYTVSFSMAGEVTLTSDPLTKASTNDVYGINVYYDKNKDGNINAAYAYGMFDNVASMKIELLEGYKYKFECTLVKDAKTKLEKSNVGKFEAPFGQILENKFVTGGNVSMSGIKSGKARLKGSSKDTNIPPLDRYYGETTNYTPAQNGTVQIELTRCVFGARFIVTGVVEGTLNASWNDWTVSTTTDYESDEIIYTFPDVYTCWQNKDNITLDATVKADYKSNRGSNWDISISKSFQFKRKVLTSVNISVSPDLSGANFNITEEDLAGDNNIDIGLDGDGIIIVDVEPSV